MAKGTCCVCGKALGIFSDKLPLKDGFLCNHCLHLGGISELPNSEKLSVSQITETLKKKAEIVRNFRPTRRAGKIEIDMNAHAFRIKDDYFFFNELTSFKYHEYPDNHQTPARVGKSKGEAVGAVIGILGGGLIGSAIGSTVGGKIGSLFSQPCERMHINITLNNPIKSAIRIDFISQKTGRDSEEYSKAVHSATQCIEALESIQQYLQEANASQEKAHPAPQQTVFVQDGHVTAAQIEEELQVYRRLLYSDIITQDEFDQKKKQLLSMM